jgi:ParB family chromosome partitioning protein
LSSLIPSEVANAPLEAGGATVLIEVPLNRIITNQNQPRKVFDEDSLASLTASVRELGVLQPLLVRPMADERYELVAGERRLRAAKRAGLPTVPVVVRTVDDTTSLEHALVENLHRQDLNPLEEAAAYQQLIEDFHLTHDQVATRVGKSRAAISNTLRLFQLPPAIQKMVVESRLSAGHARALLGTPDRAFQEHLAKRAVTEGLSVRDVEEAVRQRNERGSTTAEAGTDAGSASASAGSKRLRPPGLLELEELFSAQLDTRVQVTMGGSKGRVMIEFADLEDLERIYRVIAEGGPGS